jgi:hypothetical protein
MMEELKKQLIWTLDGIGKYQNVNDIEVFVKGKYAEDSLKELHRFLKDESKDKP